MAVKTPVDYLVVSGDASSRSSRASAVQDAVTTAVSNDISIVFLPEEFFDYEASAVSFDSSVRIVREGCERFGWDWVAYGAHPDAADNASAIQAAIDQCVAAGGGECFGPTGTFRITEGLFVPVGASVTLSGEGQVSTVIEKTTGAHFSRPARPARNGTISDSFDVDAVLGFDHPDNDFRNQVEVRDLTLRGRGQGTTGFGVYAPRLKRAVFENVHIEELDTGFLSYQLFQVRGTSVRCEYVGEGFAVRDDGSGLGASTTFLLQNCYVNHASRSGYDLFGLSYSQVVTCAADDINQAGTTNVAAYRIRACRGMHLLDSGCEDSKVHVVWATGSRLTITGFRTQNIDGLPTGTTAYLRFETGRYTVSDCRFDPFRSPSQSFNEIIQNGAQMIYIDVQRPSGGKGFISYSGGSTHILLGEGELSFAPAGTGTLVLPRFTDVERPAAGRAGRILFNTDDGNLNIDDGSGWILPDGCAA